MTPREYNHGAAGQRHAPPPGASTERRLGWAIALTGGFPLVEVVGGDSTWGESTLTWNTRPTTGAALASTTIATSTQKWYEWDVTSFLQAERAAGRRPPQMR